MRVEAWFAIAAAFSSVPPFWFGLLPMAELGDALATDGGRIG